MSTEAGRAGEEAAARFLARRGYEIVARNVRLGRGELDIVAARQELLAFVEVKAHREAERSLLAVTEAKQRRLRSAAEAFLAGRPELAALQCRFDLIILTPRRRLGALLPPRIEHLCDVFR